MRNESQQEKQKQPLQKQRYIKNVWYKVDCLHRCGTMRRKNSRHFTSLTRKKRTPKDFRAHNGTPMIFRRRLSLFETIPQHNIIPLNMLEDDGHRICTRVLMGFTRCGNYMIAYHVEGFNDEDDFSTSLNSYHFNNNNNDNNISQNEDDDNPSHRLTIELWAFTDLRSPLRFVSRLTSHPFGTSPSSSFPSLSSLYRGSPSYVYRPPLPVSAMRMEMCQSLDESIFLFRGYTSSQYQTQLHTLSIFPSPIGIPNNNNNNNNNNEYCYYYYRRWGIVLSYHSVHPHIETRAMTLSTCTLHHDDGDLSMCIPTADSVQIIHVMRHRIHYDHDVNHNNNDNNNDNISDGDNSNNTNDSDDDDNNGYSDNGAAEYCIRGINETFNKDVVLVSESTNTVHNNNESSNNNNIVHITDDYINIKHSWYFAVEEFLQSLLISSKREKIMNYSHRVIQKCENDQHILIMVMADICRKSMSSESEYREFYRVASDCILQVHPPCPHVRVVRQASSRLMNEVEYHRLTCGNSPVLAEQIILRANRLLRSVSVPRNPEQCYTTLSNASVFTGRSLDYIMHPHYPMAIGAPVATSM